MATTNSDQGPMTVPVSSAYLPGIEHMANLAYSREVVICGAEFFRKSTAMNRCLIAGVHGKQMLTIPVKGGRGVRKPIHEVQIANEEPWQRIHRQSICSAYGKSAYFLFYEELFIPAFYQKTDALLEWNTRLLQAVLTALNWPAKISTRVKGSSFPEQDTEAAGSKNLAAIPYRQVFEARNGFIAGLSILDLIFNLGPDASAYLEACRVTSK